MSWDRNGIGSCQFIVQCSVRSNEAVQLVDRLYNFVKKNICREKIDAELGWLNVYI